MAMMAQSFDTIKHMRRPRNKSTKPLLEQNRHSGVSLSMGQLEKVKTLLYRLEDLTSSGRIKWDVTSLSSSEFYYYEPNDGVNIRIHGYSPVTIRKEQRRSARYDATIEFDRKEIGTFSGTLVDDLGRICYSKFTVPRLKKEEIDHDNMICSLDEIASEGNSRVERSTDEMIDIMRRESKLDTPNKQVDHNLIDRSEFFNDESSYDKEKPKEKSSSFLGMLLSEMNPLRIIGNILFGKTKKE